MNDLRSIELCLFNKIFLVESSFETSIERTSFTLFITIFIRYHRYIYSSISKKSSSIINNNLCTRIFFIINLFYLLYYYF